MPTNRVVTAIVALLFGLIGTGLALGAWTLYDDHVKVNLMWRLATTPRAQGK